MSQITEKTDQPVVDPALKVKDKTERRKKVKRHITDVVVSIFATFNNTIVTVADSKGNALSQSSAGKCGFKGSRKSTPFAGGVVTLDALKKAKDLYNFINAVIRISGPGPSRDSAIRAVLNFAEVKAIFDVTKVPFNGCQPPKERRV